MGPIPSLAATILFFIPKVWTGFCALFLLNERIILRFLSIFIWKTVPPIDEKFFLVALTVVNELLAMLLSIWGVMGFNVEQDTLYILSGERVDQNETPIFR